MPLGVDPPAGLPNPPPGAADHRPRPWVAPGFEPVEDEFRRNFSERDELGAAFAVVRGGEPIVDLWGGLAEGGGARAWEPGTLAPIFSGSKGLVAICLLLLIDRGRLDLEDPVADHWPEFAAAGKGAVRVEELVSHRACLPGLLAPVSTEMVRDDKLMAALLAEQAQLDDPRAARCYHPLTFGWLCGELVRRVDGRSIGRFFAEEVAEPLGLEIYLGLSESLEPRVATLELAESWGSNPAYDPPVDGDPLLRCVWGNPTQFARGRFPWNERAHHAAEIPGAGAIATARSMARLYGGLGQVLSRPALDLAVTELDSRTEPLLGIEQRFGVGFMLQVPTKPLGPPADAFGHDGAGGSAHGAWPAHELGFSYVMNRMRDDCDRDPRAAALLEALASCLEVAPSTSDPGHATASERNL